MAVVKKLIFAKSRAVFGVWLATGGDYEGSMLKTKG